MRMAVAMAALGLAVSACGAQDQKPAENTPDAAAPQIANVKLDDNIRVVGNEPFWSVDLAPAGITYSRIEEAPLTGVAVKPAVTGNMAVWETTLADKRALTVTLTGTDCSDGMSDRVYPLAAMVKVGEETLQGCAASLEALERASESGRVE
ncbi:MULTISPECIES: COG3650 family protein [unclassified Brevundimonas]|uniref:COG3650 family protein n=1 Tax=unclassified Brevundimonas TaxID=2622653 RepID=UPI0025BF85AD|nr:MULTISPECIES: hypothetical protein [unclassified Brevundimonas]